MQEVIDAATSLGSFAVQLRAAGVKTVIRYYNHRNSQELPSKALTDKELAALFEAGLSVAVVFQQGGGAEGRIGELDAAHGKADATRALQRAGDLGQPAGSAIYFAVDWDYFRASDLAQIASYFQAAKIVLNGAYTMGAYGSGTVGGHLKRAGLVDHIWLAGAKGWSGTRQMLHDGGWSLFQRDLEQISPIGRINYDGNVVNPTFANFGQFSGVGAMDTPRGEGTAALYEVTARTGLIVRSGPGEGFARNTALPLGAIVTGRERDGRWISVDIEGDGKTDGYMHEGFLRAVSGGLPLAPAVPQERPLSPIDVARGELRLGVAETPSPLDNNPRIVMYHATTTGGAGSDEVAWCSSFVNYCVEQAGLRGTDSKGARSWHNSAWGRDVTSSPQEGDIVVFSRTGGGAASGSGHVGFYLDDDAGTVQILGGNQGNRISIDSFPKNGQKGSFTYKLLSIRRA